MYSFFRKQAPAMLVLAGFSCHAQEKDLVYHAGQYILYRDSIVQGEYAAKALSDKEIVSNYKSPVNEFKSPSLTFKFSINGKDNEMESGIDHHFIIEPQNGYCETPLIRFGEQLKYVKPAARYLSPNTILKVRLDMRHVMQAFKTHGYYTAFGGEKIYKSDFKGVYVAGSTAPLTWDFKSLLHHPELELRDQDGDGIYEVILKMNSSEDHNKTIARWRQSKDGSIFPAYSTEYRIVNALYNMSIEEMINAIEPDSTFRTGKQWAGVWTRDISYSIILAMAHLQPEVSMYSLLRKVNKKKKIIQDTGTGGAWPVSTDRMIWAVAAWELYKVTGNNDWLREAYTIIQNSVNTDYASVYDKRTGLVKGESSFLDWREQTYPAWMQPVDIAESECLSTNAAHYQANIVLSKMAAIMNDKIAAEKYSMVAKRIAAAINTYLWQPSKKFYGQFLYGRNYKILSPSADVLGEALAVLFDIADKDKQKQIVSSVPVSDYGITCIYPQIPDIPPYHNNGIWPFVQAYWLLAAAKAENEKAVMESIAAIYRPAALWLTNKENFVATNGDFLGTQINSDNMLWSVAGNISIVHKVLFGIRFKENALSFEPFVPTAFKGKHQLRNFKYRDAVLNIEVEGTGNKVARFIIDGDTVSRTEIAASLKGEHHIKIILANNIIPQQPITKGRVYFSLPAPKVVFKEGKLHWESIQGAREYKIFRNGKPVGTTRSSSFSITKDRYAEYQVIAIDSLSISSLASEPFTVVNNKSLMTYEVEEYSKISNRLYKGFKGEGFSETDVSDNRIISIPIVIRHKGIYAIDFRYANGNGPVNTDNKCALRTLKINGKTIGVSMFPQRGKDEWADWGFSNSNKVKLKKGNIIVSLVYEASNENMNEKINHAIIDQMRVIKIR